MRRLPLILILALLLLACERYSRAWERMLHAESIVDLHPDSAKAILDSIDIKGLNDKEINKYRLASAIAHYRMGILDTCDSSIKLAASYYKAQGDDRESAKAYYHYGIVSYNRTEYGEAIVNLLKAEKLAQASADTLLEALVYRKLGDCFEMIDDLSSALCYFKKSLDLFSEMRPNRYYDYALLDVARALYTLSRYEESISYADSAYQIGKDANDEQLMVNALSVNGNNYLWLKDYDKSVTSFERIISIDSLYMSAKDYMNLGIAYIKSGESEKAMEMNRLVLDDDSTECSLSYLIEYGAGDYEAALGSLNRLISWQNGEVEKIWRRDYTSLIERYYKAEETRNILSLESERRMRVIIVLISVSILIILLTIYFFRTQLLKREIEKNLSIAQNLREILSLKEVAICDINDDISDMSAKHRKELDRMSVQLDNQLKINERVSSDICRLLSSKFDVLESLCETYYLYRGKPNEKTQIYKSVMEIIDDIRGQRSIYNDFEDTLNNYQNSLMRRFRNDYPNLNGWEYDLFMSIVLGFSPQAISIFQDINVSLVYTRKSSLKRKIKGSNTHSSAEYLAYFN